MIRSRSSASSASRDWRSLGGVGIRRPSEVPDRNRRPADQAARPPMGLELRVQQLRGGGDDNPLTVAAEAKQRGPPLCCRHPIAPPSSPVVWPLAPPPPVSVLSPRPSS